MEQVEIDLEVDGVEVHISALRRRGPAPTLVCLHGFGSTKEDYADLAIHPSFADRDLVMFDAPGCGRSEITDPAALSIPFLVETALAVIDHLGVDRFHVSGHSMGGLTALMLAREHPDRVRSFFDIEGNLAPEDCFLSRQIIEFPADGPDAFFDAFVARVAERDEYASRLYAATLAAKVRPTSVGPIFRSMVEISDSLPLLDIMARLPFPKTFVYGEQNRHLSYLADLPALGVEVVEIAASAHFPMYSNPPALWAAMADFLASADRRP